MTIASHSSDLAGQVALVTGAASGIGAAVVQLLAERGVHLALVDRLEAPLQKHCAAAHALGVKAQSYPLDLRDGHALEAMVTAVEQQLGPIDLLINVAGVLHVGDVLALEDSAWEDCFAVNTTAVFRLCRAVARYMQPRGHGCILTISSNAAHIPRMGMAAYAASKAATSHFMRCLGLELASSGIRCNTVSPGSTDTPMQQAFANTPEQTQRILSGQLDRYRLGIPLGRIAHPQDIAEALLFLASPQARHITLHDLVIDGGATLGI